MKVALTAWENRISPVFDSANRLLIAEVKDAKVIEQRYESFNPAMTARLPEALTNFGIEILICGAISRILSEIIQITGIQLIPFVGGNVDEVLECFAKGLTIVPDFLMPGCGHQRCQRRGKGKGCGQGSGCNK